MFFFPFIRENGGKQVKDITFRWDRDQDKMINLATTTMGPSTDVSLKLEVSIFVLFI